MRLYAPANHLALKSDDLPNGTLASLSGPSVCIVGGGLSGICAGTQLVRRGNRNFIVFEAKNGWGGTWADNTYWGAAVDIPTTFYSFSFAPSNNWINNFSRQPELKLYAETVAAKWNLGPHLITRTRVVSIAWNRAENRYHVTTQDDRKDGLTKTWAFDFVIVGTGQLNVPSTPDIPGLQSFKGDQWHSARWRDDISLEGKKVLVIGNGATAAQFVPEVAKVAGNLKVFARSQNWILRRDEYLYGDWHKWALQYVPFLRQMQRFSVWLLADFVLWMAFQNKQFMIKTLQREAEKHLKNLVPGDDEKAVALRKKLTPDYAFGCRRVQFSNTFAPTFLRPNAEMITDPILRVEPSGIVTRNPDGTETLHEGDAMILATGFKTHDFLSTLEVIDGNGRKLSDRWKMGAEAYYGIMIPDLPNLFITYGPNTNLGHSSIIFMIECQVDFAMRAIEFAARRGIRAINLKQSTLDAFVSRLRTDLDGLVWSGDCSSWYKLEDGKITNNWSGRTVRYWRETARVDFGSDGFERLGESEWGKRSWMGTIGRLGTVAAVGAAVGFVAMKYLRK